MHKISLLAAVGLSLLAAPLSAQPAAPSPAASAASAAAVRAITAGAYRIDPDHTQVLWSVDHMGFSRLSGMVGEMTGTLQLDPARPQSASLDVQIPLSGLRVTSAGFAQHLQTADLFDTARHPSARFVSRKVEVRGQAATITGDLTLRGITRPVVLDARFYGAGANPMNKAETVGFSATAQLKRSEFDLGYAVPAISDVVNLEINAAFEKVRP